MAWFQSAPVCANAPRSSEPSIWSWMFSCCWLQLVTRNQKGCPLSDSTFREIWLVARICRLIQKIWGSRCEKKWFQMILKQHLAAFVVVVFFVSAFSQWFSACPLKPLMEFEWIWWPIVQHWTRHFIGLAAWGCLAAVVSPQSPVVLTVVAGTLSLCCFNFPVFCAGFVQEHGSCVLHEKPLFNAGNFSVLAPLSAVWALKFYLWTQV